MEKQYDISFSYTLDFISWTCPCCGEYVEKCGVELSDTDCPNCGHCRNEENDPSDTYNELISVTDDVDIEEEDIF